MSDSNYKENLNEYFPSFQRIEEDYNYFNYFLNSNKDDLEQKFYIQNRIGITNEGTIINGTEEEKNPNEIKDDNNENNNNIISNQSINKSLIAKKRGRPKKNSQNNIIDKKKGKYRPGNVSLRIYVSCMKKIHFFINSKFKGLELDMPTITNNPRKSHDAQRELFNKTIYEIYTQIQMVRRFKGDLKIKETNKKQKNLMKIEMYRKLKKNQKEIDSYFENNKNENEELFKVVKFQDFLKAYLNNDVEIIKEEEGISSYHLDLKGFETYEQSFNPEYSKEEKEEYKQYVFTIINKKSKDRRNRRKKCSK